MFCALHLAMRPTISPSAGAPALPCALLSIAMMPGHMMIWVNGTIHGAIAAAVP